VARVRIRAGSGQVNINGHPIEQYFTIPTHRQAAVEALRLTQTADVYDVDATIGGGGVSGSRVRSGSGLPAPWWHSTTSCGPRSRRRACSLATLARRSAGSTVEEGP